MPQSQLNERQLEAVSFGSGPLLIVAGAGTGKTTVIIERIKFLVESGLARSEEILALTFTDKAAAEMQSRLETAFPLTSSLPQATTFHSFCDRILRSELVEIGLDPNYTLMTTSESAALLTKHFFELELDYFRPLGNPYKFVTDLLSHIDRLQDENISPGEYIQWVNNQFSISPVGQDVELEKLRYQELSRSYDFFQKLKQSKGLFTFSDLIYYSLVLFQKRPNILKKYQHKYKYILVDEFQDTNFAQNHLVGLLAGSSPNLTVVADDDQAIYRWRGASLTNILSFQSQYPAAKVIVLTKNYRSSQPILDAAYRLIQFNNPYRLESQANIDKHLIAVNRGRTIAPQHMHFSRGADEAFAVVQKIKELMEDEPGHYSYKDFAVLVRANSHAHLFTDAFKRFNIPFQFLGQSRLLETPEVKDLIAYLQIIQSPHDNQAFFRLLSSSEVGLQPKELYALTNLAAAQQQSLIEYCRSLDGQADKLSPASEKSISALLALIDKQTRESLSQSSGQLLYEYLRHFGRLESLLNAGTSSDADKAINIFNFFNQLKNLEELGIVTVADTLVWVENSQLISDTTASSHEEWGTADVVNILTVHASKGLEFPVVFVVNLISGRFPSQDRKDSFPIPENLIKESLPTVDQHLYEERRLFYVAITRAKERLFTTSSDIYGLGKRTRKISQFISEMYGSLETALSAAQPSTQLPLLDWHFAPKEVSKIHSTTPLHKVAYLSYSQIQTFDTCPLHYKAKYILKISSPPSAASSFGNTIHKTLNEYFTDLKSSLNPNIFELYAKNWIKVGYENAAHANLYFAKGKQYLTEFLENTPPISQVLRLEDNFKLPLGMITVGGKIDRVDILPDGSLEIIDYKTSSKHLTPKEAQSNLQLSFYALAATGLTCHPYGKSIDKIKLSLYYLDTQEKVSVVLTADQLERAKAEILAKAEEISRSDFTCSQSQICQSGCDYHYLCDLSISEP